MYKPKKKRYPDLRTLYREMMVAKPKVKGLVFDGIRIKTKDQLFLMFDGELIIELT